MTDFSERSSETKDWLRQEFTGIRTGQAAPALIESVKVESYGTLMPLNQTSTIGVEDARTLRVSPWDAGAIKTIETALREADLGVSVVTDSSGLRVIFPELTADRRQQLLKLAKQKHEDARVSIRSVRDEAMKAIEKAEKDGDISEDEKFSQKEALQKEVEAANTELDALLKEKEAEIAI
jgi:ribosome recycling factor